VRILKELHNGALLVGGLDATLQVWDHGRRMGPPIPTAQVGLRSLLVLRNGDVLTGGYDGRILRWRGLHHLKPSLLNGDSPVLSLAELPNGDILSGSANGHLRRLRWPTWQGPLIATGQEAILSIVPLSNREWWTAGRDGTLKKWRDGHPTGQTLRVEEAKQSWRIIQLQSGDLLMSSGNKSWMRKLVPPGLVIREACLRLRGLPELRSPINSVERAASRVCKAAT
jgi:hypothetical protein